MTRPRMWRCVALLIAGAVSSSCDNSIPTAAGKSPIPPSRPSPVLLLEGSCQGLPEHLGRCSVPFVTTAKGTITTRMTWTDGLHNYVTSDLLSGSAPCSSETLETNNCPFLAASTDYGENPSSAVKTYTNQPGGAYRFYVINQGPGQESVAFQIFVTTP